MQSNLFPQPISLSGYQTVFGGCSYFEQVCVRDGNLARQYTVVQVPNVGPALGFQLTHNSLDSHLGVVGRNWRHVGGSNLSFSGSPVNLVTYTSSQGREHRFEWDTTNSVWKHHADSKFLPVTLTQVGTDWLLAEYPDGNQMKFNSSGRLVEMQDAHGQTLTYTYSGSNLTTITESTGRSITLAYSSGLISSITDPSGNETLLIYDGNSNLTSIVGPEGCLMSFTYVDSTSGRIATRTDSLNHTYSYSYHSTTNRLATVTDPESQQISYSYDTVSELLSRAHLGGYTSLARTTLTDARAKVWEYRFDGFGNLWRIIDPLGHIKRMYWSDDQKLLYLSEGYTPQPEVTGYLGPQDSVHNRLTRSIYDSAGNQLAQIDANGLVTQMEYDPDSRLIGVTPGRATLAVGGDWFEHFGEEGFVMCSALDTSSDLVQLPAYVDGSILAGDYDSSDAFVRDNQDLPKHRMDVRAPWIKMPGTPPRPTYQRTLGMWKSSGTNQAFTFRIPMAETRDFNLSLYMHCADQPYQNEAIPGYELTYSGAFGRDIEVLVTDNDPVTGLRRRQSFRYPNTGPGVWMTFAVHGVEGEVVRVKLRSRVINTYEYPALSVIAFDPPQNRRTVMTYTGSDLTSVVNPLGQTTSLEYNTDGTLSTVTDAKSRETQFFYEDTHKNLTRIVDGALGETSLTYDLNGNVLTLEDPDSRTVTLAYDAKNRMTSATDPLGHATIFEYDVAGNLSWVRDAQGNTTAFRYTPQNRLAAIVNALGHETLFAYNASGSLSQITDPLGRVSLFVYDDAGRLIETVLADEQSVRYALNAVNRLVSITGPNGNQADWEDIDTTGAANVLKNSRMELNWNFANTAPRHWSRSDDNIFSRASRSSAEAHSGTYSLPASTGQSWLQQNVPTYAGGRYVAGAWAKKASGGASDFLASITGAVRDFQAATVTQSESTQDTAVDTSWTELKPMVLDIRELPGSVLGLNVFQLLRFC